MSDFKFDCPHCKQALEAPKDMLGQTIECPSCQGSILIPELRRPAATHPLAPPPGATPAYATKHTSFVPIVIGAVVLGVVVVGALIGFMAWHKNHKVTEITNSVAVKANLRTVASPQPFQVTVKGGAWTTNKAGNSEVLRGLKVYLLKASANNRQVLPLLKTKLAEHEKDLTDVTNQIRLILEQNNQNLKEHSTFMNEREIGIAERTLAYEENLKEIVSVSQNLIRKLSQQPPTQPMDLNGIYKLIPENPSIAVASLWESIADEQLADDTHTDIDGTYEMTVTGDSFYLYARRDTVYSSIEWFIPVTPKEAGTIKVDLQNSNAAFIRNKSDEK